MAGQPTVTHDSVKKLPDVHGPTPPKRVETIRRTDNGKGNEKGS